MKIEHLEIKKYKQFTDLTLDLTYPKGHKKEGEPLDKICIIGQSGTGKTNLLKVIRDRLNNYNITTKFNKEKKLKNEKVYFLDVQTYYQNKYVDKDTMISIEDEKVLNKLKNKKNQFLLEKIDLTDIEFSIMQEKGIVDLTDKAQTIYKNIHKLDSAIQEIENRHKSICEKNIDNKIIAIGDKNNSWKILKEKIDNYDNEKSSISKQLANKLVHNLDYSKEDFIQELNKWEQENENILEKIAMPINDIIKKFNLELKIDETTQSYEELILKDLATEKIVQYEDISTGTKNLLSTFIPLKSYNPKDSIILIDEPENSFYPDIQRMLTELYMEVGENNQLIMATHSPLIASSFEPWEVVELKFDENNQIYRELYYEGENHVDNYTLDPRMLTWTSLLTDVFDLKEDSNFNFREKKLMEYGMLKAEIKAMGKGQERDEKMKHFKKLSQLLGLQN